MASISLESRNELIALYTAMFNAAPGANNLNDMVAQAESGKSLLTIAQGLTGKADFTTVYPAFLTADEFAARLVGNLLGSEVSASASTWATNWVKTQLAAGKGPAFVISTAVQSIRATTNADFTNAKAMMANKVDVASYYSVTKALSDPDLADLQSVISGISSVATTVTTAKATVDGIADASTGLTYTLTTGVDTISANKGNDVFNGTNTTATGLDSINGGAGIDTLNFNDVAGGTNISILSVSNVENIVVRSAAAAPVTTTAFTGVESLKVTQGTSATVISGSSAAVEVSGVSGVIIVDGGKSQSVTSTTGTTTVTVGATTVSTGDVAVTHSAQAANAIATDGGAKVSITAGGVTTGAVTVGQGGATTDLPTGAVSVTSTGADYTAATAVTLGGITISGGSSVSVTQTAASATTAAAADTAAANRTQSAVSVTGSSATTEVSVSQSAPVTAVNAVAAVAGVKEAQNVTFTALTATQTAVVNGLTFTAVKALTANEVAAAFANLAAGATHGSAPVTSGVYSGTFSSLLANGANMTSGAASGATVTFTEGTASAAAFVLATDNDGAGAGAPVALVTGVTAVTAVTGVMGVVGGDVDINGAITGTDVLKTVSLTGFGVGSSIASDALAALTLASSNEDVTVTNAASSTLDLTLNAAGISTNTAVAGLGATYKTLNIKTTGANSDIDITAGGVETLTVSGDKVVDLNTPTMGALKTVTVSGSAGLSGTLSGIASITSVDASATSGAVTVTIDAATAAYKGGTGADSVTLNTTTVTKDVTLGAGDDTLTLATGQGTPTGTLTGGDGTDTISMFALDAETVSAGTAFEAKFSGFEKLKVTQVLGAQTDTVDLSNMNDISYVISTGTGTATGSLVVNKMASAGTIELTGATAAAADVIDINLTDATGTSDSLNVVTKVSTTSLHFGTLDLTGIESIAITATDTNTSTITGGGVNTATVIVKDAALKTATVTGSSHLTLTLDAATTALTSLNASALTGNLTTTTNGTVAQTVTGGAGADVLTAKGTSDVLLGGAGNDTLALTGTLANLVTLTGGAGTDTFQIGVATVNVNSYATITDLAAGDKIQFSAGAATFATAKVSLGDTAVFQDYANAAINATNTGDVTWFQSGGNTYVVENVSNGTSFTNGTDIIVRITGAVDLSTASFSSSADTLLIA